MLSAVIFDLDGTLTTTPSPWRHIHERLGVWESHASVYFDEWLSGKLTYDEFCRRDTSLWNGRSLPEIEGYLDEIEVNRYAPTVIQTLVARGVPSIIISSGFRYVARKIQAQWNWAPLLIYANELVAGPEVRIHVSADPASPISKKAHADAALRLVGADAGGALVVSDALRDLEQLGHCGFHLHIQKEDDLARTLQYLD